MRVIHRRDVNPTPVHNIIIRDHNPREGSQEHGVSVHKGEESLDTKRTLLNSHEIDEASTVPSKDLPRTKSPSAQKRTNDLSSSDVDIPW